MPLLVRSIVHCHHCLLAWRCVLMCFSFFNAFTTCSLLPRLLKPSVSEVMLEDGDQEDLGESRAG